MKLTSVGALVVGFWGVSIGMTVSTTRGINSSITSTSRGGIGDNRPGQSSTTTTERMLLFELKNGTKMGSMSLLATTQMKMMMSTSTERMKTGSPPMSGPRGNYKAATEGSEAGVTESVPRNGGRGCAGSRFLPKSMSENITKDCIDLIGFRMENFPPKEEDLVKVNYEDKVLTFTNSALNVEWISVLKILFSYSPSASANAIWPSCIM